MDEKKNLNRREFLKRMSYGSLFLGSTAVGGGSFLIGTGRAKASSAKMNLKFACHTAAETTNGRIAKKFAELVEEKSNGEIVVNVFYGAQLGTEKEQIEGVRLGTIDVCLNSGTVAQWLLQAGVTDLPFLYKDYEHAYKSTTETYINYMHARLETVGFRTVGMGCNTPRETLSLKPLRTLADWKNLKIRVPESPLWVDTFKALGAVPTPVAWPEVYGALQTGIVEAMESAVIYMYAAKHYEICKYLNMTAHIYNQESILMGESWFRRQPKDVQKIFMDAGKGAYDFYRDRRWEIREETIKKMVKAGVTVIEPNREELARAVKPLHDKFADKYKLHELIERMRAA
jgi:tripartite ATP-independent transporter DctP family solute receptor